jgi:hypothetical protein
MQTTELPAGQELDALIAERVMGWHVERYATYGAPSDHWHDATGSRVASSDWSPSTDIAAAWQIVERLRLFDSAVGGKVLWQDEDTWHVGHLFWEQLQSDAHADTPMLAICRAALTAVSALPD